MLVTVHVLVCPTYYVEWPWGDAFIAAAEKNKHPTTYSKDKTWAMEGILSFTEGILYLSLL